VLSTLLFSAQFSEIQTNVAVSNFMLYGNSLLVKYDIQGFKRKFAVKVIIYIKLLILYL
jgi:hypothetical protein